METTQRIERLPVDRILIDAYQRTLNNRRVERIAHNFNHAKLGVPVVSRREDGSFAAIDGQHRLSAMRKLGITMVNCIVLEGLTREQEADYFRRQNEDVATISTYDLYRAGLYAGDPHYLRIEGVLTKYGYKVGVVTAPMTITAINALSRIVETFGIAVLDKMLGYITVAWHGDPTAVRREMLAGFAEFTMRFGDRVTAEQFAARLGGKLPSDIFFAYRVRAEGRLTAHSAFVPLFRRLFCVILCDIYNKGMNSQSRQRLKMND